MLSPTGIITPSWMHALITTTASYLRFKLRSSWQPFTKGPSSCRHIFSRQFATINTKSINRQPTWRLYKWLTDWLIEQRKLKPIPLPRSHSVACRYHRGSWRGQILAGCQRRRLQQCERARGPGRRQQGFRRVVYSRQFRTTAMGALTNSLTHLITSPITQTSHTVVLRMPKLYCDYNENGWTPSRSVK